MDGAQRSPQGEERGRRAPNQCNLAAGNPSAAPIKRHDGGLDLSGSLHGAGGVGGLIRTHVSDVNYLPCYDGNGNVTELSLATTGGFAAQYQYDPFGREITSSGLVAPLNFYRFSTKQFDRETEFSYYGYRYYNAVLGRWLNRDPSEELGGRNLYAMVGNDAMNQWDYLGLLEPGPGKSCKNVVIKKLVAKRAAAAVAVAVVDGPLPIGDVVAVGLLVWTIVEVCEIICNGDDDRPKPCVLKEGHWDEMKDTFWCEYDCPGQGPIFIEGRPDGCEQEIYF